MSTAGNKTKTSKATTAKKSDATSKGASKSQRVVPTKKTQQVAAPAPTRLASYRFLQLAAAHVESASRTDAPTAATTTSRRTLNLDDGAYAALVTAVLAALISLLQAQKPSTYEAVGLKGTMDNDYRYTAQDFPLFLNAVKDRLWRGTPRYNFNPDVTFAQKYLSLSAIKLAVQIDKVTTAG